MMPKKISKNGLTINISKMTPIEKLIEKLKEASAKEQNLDVKTGLRIALLEAYIIQADEITESFKQIKSN